MFVFFCEPSPNFLCLKQGGGDRKHTHTHTLIRRLKKVFLGGFGRLNYGNVWVFLWGFLSVIIDDSNNLPFGNVESKGPTPPVVPTQEIRPYSSLIKES